MCELPGSLSFNWRNSIIRMTTALALGPNIRKTLAKVLSYPMVFSNIRRKKFFAVLKIWGYYFCTTQVQTDNVDKKYSAMWCSLIVTIKRPGYYCQRPNVTVSKSQQNICQMCLLMTWKTAPLGEELKFQGKRTKIKHNHSFHCMKNFILLAIIIFQEKDNLVDLKGKGNTVSVGEGKKQ